MKTKPKAILKEDEWRKKNQKKKKPMLSKLKPVTPNINIFRSQPCIGKSTDAQFKSSMF